MRDTFVILVSLFFLNLESKGESFSFDSDVHDVLQYISTTLNLANKDLILIIGGDDEDQIDDKTTRIVNEIVSSKLRSMISIISPDYSINVTHIHQNQQLIVCYSLLKDNFGSYNFPKKMLKIFNFTQYHWTHNILHLPPSLQEKSNRETIQQLNNFSKTFSSMFRLNSKLRIIASGSKEYAPAALFEAYSISDLHFLNAVPPKMYSYPNGSTYNFMGAQIKATAVDEPTNEAVVTYDKSSNETKFIGGLGVFDFWDIRDMLNFSIFPMKGSNDISADEDDNFLPTGIGQQLFEEAADISILHSYHLPEYVHYLKPLVAMGEDSVFVTFRQPPTFAVRNAFSKPFSNTLWMLIGLTWAIIIISILTFLFLLHLIYLDKCRNRWDITEVLLWSTAAFCQRSFFRLPQSTSLKLIFLFALLFSLSVYTIYSAQIISSLTAEFLPIRTINELVEYHFKILANPNKFYSYALMQKSNSLEDKLNYRNELGKTYTNDLDAIQQVANGFKMHFNTLDIIHLYARELQYSDKETCKIFHYIPLGTLSLTSGFYVKKNSPLQEPFNIKLIIIMERGLNERYIKNYYEATLIKCPKSKTRYREDLGIMDVFTAFAILAVGFFLALVLLFTEVTFNSKRNIKTKKY